MRTTFLFLAVFFCISVGAQPVITASSLPVAGFSASLQTRVTSTPFSPGAAGENVTWNFATFSAGTLSTVDYVACPGMTGCSSFPTGTLAASWIPDGNGSITYYSTVGGIQAIVGVKTSGVPTVYSDPEDWIRMPMTYNSQFTDQSVVQLPFNGSRNGSVTSIVDGWGTLITPAGTYNDVLRVKRTAQYVDSVGTGIAATQSVITYLWYSPAFQDWLFLIGSLQENNGPMTYSIGYHTGAAASVGEISASTYFFQAAPNPAKDRLILRWGAGIRATASLTDLTGRTIIQHAGRGSSNFAVGALPRGLYLLRVQDEGGTVHSGKVVLH